MIPLWAAIIYGLACGLLGVALGAVGCVWAAWSFAQDEIRRGMGVGR